MRSQELDPHNQLENSEATGEFSKTFDEFFDLLDKKTTATAVRKQNLPAFNEVIIEHIFIADIK